METSSTIFVFILGGGGIQIELGYRNGIEYYQIQTQSEYGNKYLLENKNPSN